MHPPKLNRPSSAGGGGILVYRSFAYFETGKTYNVLEGRIPNFSGGDVTLAVIVDGKKEDTFPDKKNHRYIGYVCNNDNATIEWDKDSWIANLKNIKEPTVCTLKFESFTSRNLIEALKESNELVTFTHEDTIQTGSNTNTDYRYVGSDPNNYVKFNDELWRIIGIFNTDDGTGNYEERVKLIRNESIGNMAWDTNGQNDWSNASLQKYLNEEYYNNLTEQAKGQISNVKWYLGGVSNFQITPEQAFKYEREIAVYNGRTANFNSKIGIMYPSDFGLASTDCINLSMGSDSAQVGFPKCFNNIWITRVSNIFSGGTTWFLTPLSDRGNGALSFYGYAQRLSTYDIDVSSNKFTVVPVTYLKYNIETTTGDESKDNPYELLSE